MKKILVALGFAMAATSAQADFLSSATGGSLALNCGGACTPVALVNFGGDELWGGDVGSPWLSSETLNPAGLYTSGVAGTLVSLYDNMQFTAEYLGKVALHNNSFFLDSGAQVMDNSTVGSTLTMNINAGAIDFGFFDVDGTSGVSNTIGSFGLSPSSMLFLDATSWNKIYGTSFEFLVGFNDTSLINGDNDDYVVGVSAVPVPAALPLMASGLGLLGFSARRKQKATA